MITMCSTEDGSAFHASRYAWTCPSNCDVPAGTSNGTPEICATRTVCTSGCLANQLGTSRLRSAQWVRSGSPIVRVIDEYGQPPSAIEIPYQPFALATCATAPRQFSAWLSPSSATVADACSGGVPNAQSFSDASTPTTVHGAFGRWRATAGDGTTSRPSLGLWHGFDGSRDAAPKQRGSLESRAVGAAAAIRPGSGAGVVAEVGAPSAVAPTPTARSAHASARRRGPLESIVGRHRPRSPRG